MLHTTWHAISVFFHHLASVHWHWLGIAVAIHLCKLLAVSRAWQNIISAAYPDRKVRWRQMFGAYVAGTGVNAVIPARGGDVPDRRDQVTVGDHAPSPPRPAHRWPHGGQRRNARRLATGSTAP